MMLEQKLTESIGYCNADTALRDAINEAILGRPATWHDGDTEIANVIIEDDESEHAYNAENIKCCIARLVSAQNPAVIWVGYYSDGAQHALDIVAVGSTVEDWAALWDADSYLPEYLHRRALADE